MRQIRAHVISTACMNNGDPFASTQLFDISRGAGEVRTTGANFCLDSTTQFPPDGQGLKLWTWWGSLDL
jgi:hypothetical protein